MMLLTDEIRASYLELLKQEVKPALGCTEPIAVALATTKSKELLGVTPTKIEAKVSANILKNGMGVGIPGTGMVGLDIAAALGVICGKSEYGLEVLREVDSEMVAKARELVIDDVVEVKVADNNEKLYVEVTCIAGDSSATTIIMGRHDNIVYLAKDSTVILDSRSGSGDVEDNAPKAKEMGDYGLTVRSIYEFATTEPYLNIKFILEAAKINRRLSAEGLTYNYGLKVGKTLLDRINTNMIGDGIMSYSMAMTAAASDARMAGCILPAMSNSGSGNQGITVTMPVVATSEKLNSSLEELARALVISHLTAVHIKSYLGRLSALCGCVVASTGSSCGIILLLGGGYDQMTYAIKNMIGNITGMVCDGAKVGCALKVSSGVSSAVQSAILAMDNICISDNDGIIENDIEKTIYNLGKLASIGMQTTDEVMLDIMIKKNRNQPMCL